MLDPKAIADFYNNIENVWGNNDQWHLYSYSVIEKQLKKIHFKENAIILNAGSAGNTYGIDSSNMYHVDIAKNQLKDVKNSYIASIESMPFKDNFFDYVICVGSVINYCDAIAAIHEMSRVLKPGGTMILEYESSLGFEYYGKECYGKDASVISVMYLGFQHKQWLYSPNYIKNALYSAHIKILRDYRYHIIDGITFRWLGEDLAIKLLPIDTFFRLIPPLSKRSNNRFLLCTKMAPP